MVRLGLLSTADIQRAHLAAVGEQCPVVAVASRNPARAQAFAREFGIGRAHASYEALLTDEAVDAVVIALPNALHHHWTMLALEAGKHVLCEKPYTRHPAEAEAAWNEAEGRGLILMEAFMWRHAAQTALVLELLPRLGRLHSVDAAFSFEWHRRDDDVRLDPGLGGGSLLDVGCYCVNALRLVAGEPDQVRGVQMVGRGGVDWGFAGALRFGEVLGSFRCGFSTRERGLLIHGAQGQLAVPDPWHGHELVLNGEEFQVQPEDAYRRQLMNFVAAIRGDAEPLLGRADAIGQARTLEALLSSAAAPT
jgi:D-xylose 1-dehydrogenase (NADP+, D-xylono-1,5-lactone-forming)